MYKKSHDNQVYPEPKIAVTLCFEGNEVNINEITERLELIPTTVQTPNDWPESIKHPNKELPGEIKPRYTWNYSIQYETCKNVSIRFENLLTVLRGKENIINELKNKFHLSIEFLIGIQAHHFPHNMPAVVLTYDILKFTTFIGADISFSMCLD